MLYTFPALVRYSLRKLFKHGVSSSIELFPFLTNMLAILEKSELCNNIPILFGISDDQVIGEHVPMSTMSLEILRADCICSFSFRLDTSACSFPSELSSGMLVKMRLYFSSTETEGRLPPVARRATSPDR
ncbi:hypothetical protein DPMN_097627 [Dreissena polymorpha]|uniref:Uncharacterized protein n=1 Tax=Dreissena polymorpha TaxID=45954 RepID=A0A9D4LAL3_DREPO|nr:hypothetical protein DPMN_097627 [Dreissena polymorpha]